MSLSFNLLKAVYSKQYQNIMENREIQIHKKKNYHPWKISGFEMLVSQDLSNMKWLLETVETIQSVASNPKK